MSDAGPAPPQVSFWMNAEGRADLVVDVRHAEVDAVEERAVEVPIALQLALVDPILEISGPERVAGRRDVGRVERVDPRIHDDVDDRQIVVVIDRLVRDPEHRIADGHVGSELVVRFRFRGRMMRVELEMKPVERVPREVAAERLVDAAVGGQRAAVATGPSSDCVHAGVAEMLRIEDRARRPGRRSIRCERR